MSDAQRPNILVLCTDQQRFDAVGAYGNTEIKTPNLDRLAGEGVLFENCYVQSPVCAPSRATLMTGMYVGTHGLWANGVPLRPGQRLFTKDLDEAGYDCGMAGKLHLDACFGGRTERRTDDGFRMFRWSHDSGTRSSENAYHQWLKASYPDLFAAAVDPASPVTFDTLPAEAHHSHWIANETMQFLQAGRERDKPFCFIANFFDPHHPFGAPKEYADRYRADALSPPSTAEGELTDKPPILSEASRKSYAGHMPGFLDYSAAELQKIKAAYYAMVTLIDEEVGRILAVLDSEGLAGNTLVIFTSDHGELLGDHQLLLKGPMMYECAVKVPLIMCWPGTLPNGERRTELVQWIDLAPTVLQAAGLPPLPRGQGESLLALATGDTTAWTRDWALCQYRNSGHPYDPPVHTTMLRQGSWKLIVYHGAPATDRKPTGELYDLEADPGELTNLWHEPACRTQRHALQETLTDVLVAIEDRSQPRLAPW